MITAKEIREKYPAPIAAAGDIMNKQKYCVGGAFCMYTGLNIQYNFPTEDELIRELIEINPSLSRESYKHEDGWIVTVGADCAERILENNDAGRFEKAWEVLDEALSHQ